MAQKYRGTVMEHYTEVKSSLETNLAHLTIFMEVTDSKACIQSSTSEAWGGNDCHAVQDCIGLLCVYQAHEGLHRENYVSVTRRKAAKDRGKEGVKCTWKASYLHLHTVTLLLENVLETPENDQAQKHKLEDPVHNLYLLQLSLHDRECKACFLN